MNVQSILDRIGQDAKAAAEATLAQARERAEQMKAQALRAREKAREEALDQARAQAAEAARRMRVMAGLDARKEDLADKRALLDEVFALALSQMNEMPGAQARAHGLQMLLSFSAGGETVIPSVLSPWCDAAFIEEANAALRKAGRPGGLSLSQERRDLPSGGFVLHKGGMEMNCTYRAMLETARSGLEAEVAARLFGG